jgi:HlyD family secretion protein
MNAIWIKRLGLAVAGLAIVAAFAYALREKPVLVDVAEIVTAPMQVTIREEGVTRVREVYTISAPIAGQLVRTLLEQGDPVTRGETVVAAIEPLAPPLLDSRTEAELLAARDAAEVAVGIAEIDRKRAATALNLATEELARASKLHGPGIISESSLQRTQNQVTLLTEELAAAEETIKLRKAQLDSAVARLKQPNGGGETAASCCVRLTAPVDGVVLTMFAKSEQAVAAGMKIAEIGDPSDLEATVDLLSADAVRIRPGTKAVITDWGAEALSATVRRIEPAAFTKVSALGIEEQRVNAVLDIDSGDPRLGHGYRIFTEIVVWSSDAALQAPIGALFRDGGDWSVFVLAGDRLEQRTVTVGQMNDEVAEILDGLSAGEVVVVHPGDTLAAGVLAMPRE